jgi:hypothetical protein
MAASNPLIFESVTIGSNTYELMDSDNIEISNESEKLTVDNAQEIISGITSGFTIPIFDLSVQSDDKVLMDADVDPSTDKTTVTLNGAAGSASLELANVYVTGNLKFDRPSPYVELSLQIKSAGQNITIS